MRYKKSSLTIRLYLMWFWRWFSSLLPIGSRCGSHGCALTAAVILVFRLVRRSLLRLMALTHGLISSACGVTACGFTVCGRFFFNQPFGMVLLNDTEFKMLYVEMVVKTMNTGNISVHFKSAKDALPLI